MLCASLINLCEHDYSKCELMCMCICIYSHLCLHLCMGILEFKGLFMCPCTCVQYRSVNDFKGVWVHIYKYMGKVVCFLARSLFCCGLQ